MKQKINLIISGTILILLITILICYYNYKPRIKYIYDNNLEGYLVDKAYGNEKKYTIKDEYHGKPVLGISTRAFYNHDNLEEIVFENPENIIFIGRLSFYNCNKLKYIDLSHTEEIDKNAFQFCKSLNNLEISSEFIAGSAFYGCESLDNINLMEGVISIGTYSFSYTKFEEINLPSSMINCYKDAFKYSNIKKISYYSSLITEDYLDEYIIENNIEVVKKN